MSIDGDPAYFAGRRSLPIWKYHDNIIRLCREHQAIVLVGETGSGKTTQIPQYLFCAGFGGEGVIGVSQPRRVAAITVAQRVAAEAGAGPCGGTVGYTIRFSDVSSPDTCIKFLTDGMLLREAQLDRLLSRYSVIILDEAHERTLSTDILFAVVKQAMAERPELKVIVMSATLDTKLFQNYFSAALVTIPGRQYPVDVYYTTEPETDYIDAAVITVMQIHAEEPLGDVLVFLPGQEEIDSAAKILDSRYQKSPLKLGPLQICQLFASLTPEVQLQAFEPTKAGHRKVILATNIAETAVTINGVRFVVDPGFAKVRSFHSGTGMEALKVEPISKAQSWQRAGRAGREAPGKCFRLYKESAFEILIDTPIPEIRRVSLSTVALRLLAMGVTDLPAFPFVEPPTQQALVKALELLYNLGAMTAGGALTPLGVKLAALPVDPIYGSLLVRAEAFGCVADVIDIVAMLSADNSFANSREIADKAALARARYLVPDSDHISMLNILRAYMANGEDAEWCRDHYLNKRALKSAVDIRGQLREVCETLSIPLDTTAAWMDAVAASSSECPPVDSTILKKALLSGCFLNVARKAPSGKGAGSGKFTTIIGHHEVSIHPSSLLFRGNVSAPTFASITGVVYSELVVTSKCYMRNVTSVDLEWLPELAPHVYSRKQSASLPVPPPTTSTGVVKAGAVKKSL